MLLCRLETIHSFTTVSSLTDISYAKNIAGVYGLCIVSVVKGCTFAAVHWQISLIDIVQCEVYRS